MSEKIELTALGSLWSAIQPPRGFAMGEILSAPRTVSQGNFAAEFAQSPDSLSLVRCECPANDHFCRLARKAVSLRRPFGHQARNRGSRAYVKLRGCGAQDQWR